MTKDEIALVRQSFDRIVPIADHVGAAFYDRLFALDPTLRPLFRGSIEVQARHLMTALAMVVRSLDDLGPILGQIDALGRRHAAYGVQPSHFETVGQALLATLASRLGDEFTPQARGAWAHAYNTLAGAMTAALADASSQGTHAQFA